MQPCSLFNLAGADSGGNSLFSSATTSGSLFSSATTSGSLFSSATTSGAIGASLFSNSSASGGNGGGLFAGFTGTSSSNQQAGSAFIPDLELSNEGDANTDKNDDVDDADVVEDDNDAGDGAGATATDEEATETEDDAQEAEGDSDEDEEAKEEDDDEDIQEDDDNDQAEAEAENDKDTEDSNGNSVGSEDRQTVDPRRLSLKRPVIDQPDVAESDSVGDLRQRIKISRRSSGSGGDHGVPIPPQQQQQQQSSASSIVLRNLPEELNADEVLRRLFNGVTRVYASKAKSQAIVHFDSAASADSAMEKAASARLRARYPNLEAFRRRLPGIGAAAKTAISAPTPAALSLSSGIVPPALPASQSLADRIRVLESVERQLRVRLSKTGAVTAATCQDMCPEKERYLREDRHRVHAFEAAPGRPGVMDPARAVKEYSRSAADQEAPLPHELRPLPVLQRTLLYLASRIADIGDTEGRWQEWYEFLWDRTRAIRKEVTQQRLCSPAAAELIERCARFHVYAGARMVGMPADVFDEKINNENLTKCLQTLRELYSDLAGQCANESEFRAYMILMKLNDPNVLDEVHQLSAEVRASPQVRLALRAFFALSSNNYVTFFRAVHQADFLSACLLMRYFTQARIAALRIMSYALRRPPSAGKRVQLPLNRLPLGFEDNEDAASFCRFMGFECDKDSVWLDRAVAMAFDPTESRTVRAIRVVESKRAGRSVGECLWGGPLPELTLPPPSVSFDERGRYIGNLAASREATPPPQLPPLSQAFAEVPLSTAASATSASASIFQGSSLFSQASTAATGAGSLFPPASVTPAPLMPQQQQPPSHPAINDKQILDSLTDEIIAQALTASIRSVAVDVLDGARALSGALADAYAETFNGATRELCAEIASEVLAGARSDQAAVGDVVDSLLTEVVRETVRADCQWMLDRSLVESLDTVLADALVFEEIELTCRLFVAQQSTRRSLDGSLLLRHRARRLQIVWNVWQRRLAAKAASRARLSSMAPCAPLADPFQLVDRLHGRQPPDVSVDWLPRASTDASPAAAVALAAAAAVSRPIRLPPGTCRLVLLLSPDCPATVANWLRRKLAPSLVDANSDEATHCIAQASVLGSDARLALLHLPTLVFACSPDAPADEKILISLRLLGDRPTPVWHRDLLLGLRWLLDQPALPPSSNSASSTTLASVVESLLIGAYFRPLNDLADRCDAANHPQPPLRCLIQFYNACVVALAPLATQSAVAELRLPDAPPLPSPVERVWRVNQEAVAWLLSAYPPACSSAGAAAAAALSAGRPVSRFPWARLAARLADRRLAAQLSSASWSAPVRADDSAVMSVRLASVRAQLDKLSIEDFLPDDFFDQRRPVDSSMDLAESAKSTAEQVVVWQPPVTLSPQLSELAMTMEKLRKRLRDAQTESRLTARLLRESF